MNTKSNWNEILSRYVKRIISPDGRDTFESTHALSRQMYDFTDIKCGERILDLGCGWGKSLQPFVPYFRSVVGMDMSEENIEKARVAYADRTHITFLQGCIRHLALPAGSADLIISSLVLHQIEWNDKRQLFDAVRRVMKADGEMVMADEIILFDPEASPEKFNEVYRYLLEHTTPKEVYEHRIKPYLQDGHIYTWQEMKADTPEPYQFCSIEDLKSTIKESGLKVTEVQEITPFFGLLKIRHQ